MRALDGDTVRDERFNLQLAIREKLEESVHVAGFAPADITDGIVTALLFISGVVPAWTVGSGNAEMEFLFVIELALEVHAYRADRNHHAAIARHLSCEIYRIAVGRFGRNDNGVGALAAGRVDAHFRERRIRIGSAVGAETFREFDASLDNIHSQHSATGCFEYLDGELA